MPKFAGLTALLVAVALLVLVAGCGKKNSETTFPGQSASTAVGGSTQGSPEDELRGALENFARQKSFRAKLSADAGATGKLEAQLEYAEPDRLHVTLTKAPIPFNGIEAIAVDQELYLKTAGRWSKQGTGTGIANGLGGLTFEPSTVTSGFEMLDPTTTITRGNTETVNGKRCQNYVIKDSTQPDSTVNVCIADNLPQKLTIVSTEANATVTFSDFNANINIQKPTV